jgi:hypothetical protein
VSQTFHCGVELIHMGQSKRKGNSAQIILSEIKLQTTRNDFLVVHRILGNRALNKISVFDIFDKTNKMN